MPILSRDEGRGLRQSSWCEGHRYGSRENHGGSGRTPVTAGGSEAQGWRGAAAGEIQGTAQAVASVITSGIRSLFVRSPPPHPWQATPAQVGRRRKGDGRTLHREM